MKYTQYITDMESTLRDNNIDLIVNKKFARETNREKQLEKFKTVSYKILNLHLCNLKSTAPLIS